MDETSDLTGEPGTACYKVTFFGVGSSDVKTACQAVSMEALKAATGFTHIGNFVMDLADA